jgi:hypothetical protein
MTPTVESLLKTAAKAALTAAERRRAHQADAAQLRAQRAAQPPPDPALPAGTPR